MQKRVNVLIPFVIMLCLGSIYAWSIFVPELKATFNLSTAQNATNFWNCFGVFCTHHVFCYQAAKESKRALNCNHSRSSFLCRVFCCLFIECNFVILWLGIGVLSGLGTGLGYFVSITVPARWYPERKNFITVLMAAGFGAGAIIIAYLATFLLSRAINLLEIFLYMGVAYGILIMLVAQIIREPDTPTIPEKEIYEITKSKVVFAKLILGLFAGTFYRIAGNWKSKLHCNA
jgi:OFA family oxalate/formate antiporter-like MFS transporter